MKVVVFNSHVFWPPHYDTELEIISLHLDQGDEVTQIYCDSQFPNCELNPFYLPSVCLECKKMRQEGYRAVGKPFRKIRLPAVSPEEAARITSLPDTFQTLEELQEIELDGFDIGYGVASSVISNMRDPRPDFIRLNKTVRDFMIGAAGIFLSMKRWLTENKPDKVYVFNGRLAHTRAVLRACQQTGIPCVVHERGSNKDLYMLSENTTVHDQQYIKSRIIRTWEDRSVELREETAKRFYEKRKAGDLGFWYSFTKDQQNVFPDNWETTRKKVVIFNSSEDEFASLSREWKNDVYVNQLDGLKRICSEITDADNIQIFLRVHPNLKNVKNKDKELLYALKAPYLTLIPAESLVSSYLLMEGADCVLTFGSTMGIEATYWGKVSILAGKSFYKGLGSAYEPSSHEELMSLLRSNPPALDKTGAKMYGNYFLESGIPYKYYKAENFFSGTFNGYRLTRKSTLWSKTIEWFFQHNLMKPLSQRIYAKIKARRIHKFLYG